MTRLTYGFVWMTLVAVFTLMGCEQLEGSLSVQSMPKGAQEAINEIFAEQLDGFVTTGEIYRIQNSNQETLLETLQIEYRGLLALAGQTSAAPALVVTRMPSENGSDRGVSQEKYLLSEIEISASERTVKRLVFKRVAGDHMEREIVIFGQSGKWAQSIGPADGSYRKVSSAVLVNEEGAAKVSELLQELNQRLENKT